MNRGDGRRQSHTLDSRIGSVPSLKIQPKAKPGSLRPSFASIPSTANVSKSLARKEKSERADKAEKSEPKKRSGLESVLSEITSFTDDAEESFNPGYVEFEQKLSEELDRFQTQVERLHALRQQAQSSLSRFEKHEGSARSELENERTALSEWDVPRDKVDAMQEKVIALRDVLAASKDKLARLDEDIAMSEADAKRQQRQTTAINGTLSLSLALTLAVISYYIFACRSSHTD